jgi:hypothetical protein
MKLLDTLEDDDDVQNVYSNFEVADDGHGEADDAACGRSSTRTPERR